MSNIKSINYKINFIEGSDADIDFNVVIDVTYKDLHVIRGLNVYTEGSLITEDFVVEENENSYNLTEDEFEEIEEVLRNDNGLKIPIKKLLGEINKIKMTGSILQVGGDNNGFVNMDMNIIKEED